jgi:hypothetical protein
MSNEQYETHAPLIEELASLEHQRWAHWQRFVHDQGKRQPDGSLVLPANLVERWERQINTSYDDLTDEEKESDREQVRKYFPLLRKWLAQKNGGEDRDA